MTLTSRHPWLFRVVCTLGVLLVALVAFIATFDWNRLRPLIASKSQAYLGRELRIDGDLKMHWSWTPTLSAEQITFANAAWDSREPMFKASHFAISLAPLAMLHGRVSLPLIDLEDATVVLVKNPGGVGNWVLQKDGGATKPDAPAKAEADKKAGHPFKTSRFPVIGELRLKQVNVVYVDQKSGEQDRLEVTRGDSTEPESGRGMHWTIVGFAGATPQRQEALVLHPYRLEADLGAPVELVSQSRPWPLALSLDLADMQLRAKGEVKDVDDLTGVNLGVTVGGQHLGELMTQAGFKVGQIPPLHFAAQIEGGPDDWTFDGINLKLGVSEVRGHVKVATSEEPVHVSAALTSTYFRIDDFSTLTADSTPPPKAKGQAVAATAKAKEKGKADKAKEPAAVFSKTPFNFTSLNSANVDLTAHVKRMTALSHKADLFDDGAVELHLKDGLLTIKPLVLTVADGHLEAELRLDSQAKPPQVGLRVALSQGDLGRLVDSAVADVKEDKAEEGKSLAKPVAKEANRVGANTYGQVGGRALLTATGSSPHELMQSLQGNVGVAMQDGHISDVLTYLVALDVGKAIEHYVSGDKGSKVDCMILDFKIDKGVATTEPVLMVTKNMNLRGEGNVNLGQETLDLKLKPYPKHISIDSLRTPLLIRGTLAKPEVKPETRSLIARVVGAIAIAAVAPPAAAVLPFVEAGLGKKGLCYEHVNKLMQLQPRTAQVAKPAEVRQAPTRQ